MKTMTEVLILQQTHANSGQFSGEKPSSNKPPTQYGIHFVLPMFLGVLFCSIPLASVLTVYFNKNQCK